MTEQTPRFWRESMLEPGVWIARPGGLHWRLVKKAHTDAWFLYGMDPGGQCTTGQYMGSHLGPAQQNAQRWISMPDARPAIAYNLSARQEVTR